MAEQVLFTIATLEVDEAEVLNEYPEEQLPLEQMVDFTDPSDLPSDPQLYPRSTLHLQAPESHAYPGPH